MSKEPASTQGNHTIEDGQATTAAHGYMTRRAGRTGSILTPRLTPTQQAVLWGLARWPFISAQDLCLGLDGPGLSTVYHALSHLSARSVIEWVPYVSSRAQHERLWYLTEAGARLAAGLAGLDVAVLVDTWGLGEGALVRRLGRLEHLTLCRGFLLDLQAALRDGHRAGRAGPLLDAWRPWPVRLSYSHRHRRAGCTVDGAGTLTWVGTDAQLREAEFVLVWDDGGGLALEMLRPRLLALLRVRAAREQAAIRARATESATTAHAFPAVLVVAARRERVQGAWSLAADIARRERVQPLALLVTSAPALRTAGPTDASWHNQAGREGTLVALLAPRTLPAGQVQPAAAHGPSINRSVRDQAVAPVVRSRGVLVQGQFAHRARAALAALAGCSVRHDSSSDVAAVNRPHSSDRGEGSGRHNEYGRLTHLERALILLALRPAELRLLRALGLLPLAGLEFLATLTGDQLLPSRAPARCWAPPRPLARLLRWGLCDYDLPARIAAHDSRRYFLTARGLAVLATAAGFSPASYCRLAGAIAGTRHPSPQPPRGQSDRPCQSGPPGATLPRDGRSVDRTLGWHGGGYQLTYARRYAEHTQDVQAVFIAFVCAARAAVDAGHDHALEAWQFEWAALRRYPHDGRWQTLRPDAYGRYRVGRRPLAFFLEIDRGTSGLSALAAKFTGYCAYRDSGLYARDPAHGALAFPVLLVVTTGEERLRHILESARAVAAEQLTRPLVVWVATVADLAQHGPLGSIWREAALRPACALWPDG